MALKHVPTAVFAFTLFAAASVFAQRDAMPQLFMAFVDYDAYHDQLLNRCASRFPETAASLRLAIATWSGRNQDPLQELRVVLREKMRRDGMDEKDFDARVAESVARITAFMIKGTVDAPEAALREACTSSYAAQLAGPEMDYATFLQRVKAQLQPGVPDQRSAEGPLKLTQRTPAQTDRTQAQSFRSVAWSADGKTLAVQGHSPLVSLFDATGKAMAVRDPISVKGPPGYANIAYSRDGKWLAAGLQAVFLWERAGGSLIRRIDAPVLELERRMGSDISFAFAPDSQSLAIGYSIRQERKPTLHQIVLYDPASEKIFWKTEPKSDSGVPLPLSTPVYFVRNGRGLVFGSSEYRPSATEWETRATLVMLRSADGGVDRKIENVHADSPNVLAVSQDGRYAATGTRTGTQRTRVSLAFKVTHHLDNKDPIRIWDLDTGKLAKELPIEHYARSMAFSPDSKYLVTAHARGPYGNSRLEFLVWQWGSGRLIQKYEVPSLSEVPTSMAFSPDGRRLAAATGHHLMLFDVER